MTNNSFLTSPNVLFLSRDGGNALNIATVQRCIPLKNESALVFVRQSSRFSIVLMYVDVHIWVLTALRMWPHVSKTTSKLV